MAASKKKPKDLPIVEAEAFETARARLFCEIVALRDAWDQYQQLFARDQNTVDVLNACAPWFFGLAQRAILREVLLGISRLTDDLEQGRHINLSLPYLLLDPQIANDSDAKSAVSKAIEDAKNDASVSKQHRHKYIAHFDAAVATTGALEVLPALMQKEIERAVCGIEDTFALYSLRVRGRHAVFTTGRAQSSLRLVEILRSSDRWAEVRASRDRSSLRRQELEETPPL